MIDLKPCPFCGGLARTSKERGFWFVECPFCGSRCGYMFTEERAVKAWNRRASDV